MEIKHVAVHLTVGMAVGSGHQFGRERNAITRSVTVKRKQNTCVHVAGVSWEHSDYRNTKVKNVENGRFKTTHGSPFILSSAESSSPPCYASNF